MDPEIGPHVSDKTAITYRRAKSLGDHLVHSKFTAGGKKDLCKYPKTFRFSGCNYCQFIEQRDKLDYLMAPFLSTAITLTAKHQMLYISSPVIVAAFYVGKTIQKFWKHAYNTF